MKKFTAIISVVIVVSAAWFYLKFHYENKTVNVWQLVHKNSILVYESERAPMAWNDFIELPAWKILSSISPVDSLNLELRYLDSITGHNGQIENLLHDRNFLLSLNKVSTNRLDYVIFLSVNNNEKHRILDEIISRFRGNKNFAFDTRNFENTDLYEIKNKSDRTVFTYFIYKNYFVGSFTAYLVEDVVRNVNSNYRSGFMQSFGSVPDFPAVKGDEGNLYFNPDQIPSLLSTFADPAIAEKFKKLTGFSGPGYFDVNFEKNRVLLNGTTLASNDTSKTFLSTFSEQLPAEISCFNLMPSNTASMFDFTFQDFARWRNDVDRFWKEDKAPDLNQKKDFIAKYNLHEKDFYSCIGNEMCLADLESGDIENPSRLMLMQASDTSKIMIFMNGLAQTVNYSIGDTLFYESYGNYKIRQLSIREFPASLFGNLFSGFENTYYTLFRNYLVLGNNLEVIENFLTDIEQDNIWGKSVGFVQYFDNVQRKANISLFVNISRSYGILYNSLDRKWQDIFRKYERQFRQFDILSVQFVNINHKIYGSIALQNKTPGNIIERPSEFLADQIVPASASLAVKPYVVKNHLDRSQEVLLQDTAGTVFLVSAGGAILWKKKLNQIISDDVRQIDFFNNGKLQYLFPTSHSIQLVDRNGENVDKYPLVFGDTLLVNWLNVVDYDNSKRYRLIVADTRGKIFMFDKHGNILEGWNGIRLKGPLVQEPFHVRVLGRDCVLAIEKRGIVNVLNRRGEEYSGFPYNLSGSLNGPVFVQTGPDFKRTMINALTADGELIKLNFEGKIVDTKQLYKQGNSSYFELVPSTRVDNYIITRQDYNRISLMTRDGQELFDKEVLFSGQLQVQYYNFGVTNDIFAFTDSQQEFTYLYSRDGNLINNQPLESAFQVALTYSEANNRYKVYSCYGNQFRISSFFGQ